MQKKFLLACAALVLGAFAQSVPASNDGPEAGDANAWANLPAGVRYPEGITANPANGDIFVGTFDFGPNPNKLVRFGRNGNVEAVRDFGGQPLLGLGFAGGKVYILNFGASKLQRIVANFTSSTAVEDVASIPVIGAPAPRTTGNPDGSSDLITFGSSGMPAPNAMVFDRSGNLYISDSFQGAVFRIASATTCATPCAVTTVSHDSQLATAGFPPFGANGLALNAAGNVLYVAVTGDNRVLQMALPGGAITPFAESVHGADGLLFNDGVLWVAANQGDHIVALDSRGKVIAKVGAFEGIGRDGAPRGLLFPASMVISGSHMYVTNLALPLSSQVGDEPEEDVTRWNVARIANPLRH
jgi:DNA-binding beta-propeller fold protein YncE